MACWGTRTMAREKIGICYEYGITSQEWSHEAHVPGYITWAMGSEWAAIWPDRYGHPVEIFRGTRDECHWRIIARRLLEGLHEAGGKI